MSGFGGKKKRSNQGSSHDGETNKGATHELGQKEGKLATAWLGGRKRRTEKRDDVCKKKKRT